MDGAFKTYTSLYKNSNQAYLVFLIFGQRNKTDPALCNLTVKKLNSTFGHPNPHNKKYSTLIISNLQRNLKIPQTCVITMLGEFYSNLYFILHFTDITDTSHLNIRIFVEIIHNEFHHLNIDLFYKRALCVNIISACTAVTVIIQAQCKFITIQNRLPIS